MKQYINYSTVKIYILHIKRLIKNNIETFHNKNYLSDSISCFLLFKILITRLIELFL